LAIVGRQLTVLTQLRQFPANQAPDSSAVIGLKEMGFGRVGLHQRKCRCCSQRPLIGGKRTRPHQPGRSGLTMLTVLTLRLAPLVRPSTSKPFAVGRKPLWPLIEVKNDHWVGQRAANRGTTIASPRISPPVCAGMTKFGWLPLKFGRLEFFTDLLMAAKRVAANR
jgi:hypothetical protein